jgi:hypothetical protein
MRIAQKTEAVTLAGVDSEPLYLVGSLLASCGQNNGAIRLLKSSIEQNYCAYTALQTDPLLVKQRGSPEFTELLSSAKECQKTVLALRNQSSH